MAGGAVTADQGMTLWSANHNLYRGTVVLVPRPPVNALQDKH